MNTMKSRQGLPKKVPTNKQRQKIFLQSIQGKQTPIKSKRSPTYSRDKQNSNQVDEKSSSSLNRSHEHHRLKSKQKPYKESKLKQHENQPKNKYLQKNMTNKYNQKSEKQKDTEFVDSILEMMAPLAKKDKENKINEDNCKLHQKSADQFNCNELTTYSLRELLERQTLSKNQEIDQQMINKCSTMLKDRVNWLQFNGKLINQKKTGYGILYFKNKDKFMGDFKDDKAEGHGTYYDNSTRRRIIGMWQANQILFSQQIIVEKM